MIMFTYINNKKSESIFEATADERNIWIECTLDLPWHSRENFSSRKTGQIFKVRNFFSCASRKLYFVFFHIQKRTAKINNSVCLMAVTDKTKKNIRLIHKSFQTFALFNACPILVEKHETSFAVFTFILDIRS